MPLMVRDLRKRFGKTEALKGVSFEAFEGEVFGLLGPNGAGKTTTLRIISSVLPPDSGEVIYDGENLLLNPNRARELMSYLPEDAGTYRNLTGYEHLELTAKIYAKDEREMREFIEDGIRLADLGDRLYDKTKTYSKGMKRRLQIARALEVSPKIAVLDEPTSGVDVFHAIRIREMIKEFAKRKGAVVIISSHNMFEVEKMCDRIAIIHSGRILLSGGLQEVKGSSKDLEEVFLRLAKDEGEN
ncbi:MAG: ABC transporter ATP-binding protein [Nitrososphaeria archaeon]